MAEWRPSDWENIKKRLCAEHLDERYAHCKTCGAGNPMICDVWGERIADAMLAALRGQGHQDWLATEEDETSKGRWVFIPDAPRGMQTSDARKRSTRD